MLSAVTASHLGRRTSWIMATHFEPIARQTVAASVRDAIAQQIRLGVMQPGTPLPSEREMCSQFDVARTSVREAVQGLLILGLVSKRGNRFFVAEQMPEIRLDDADSRTTRVRELFAVRKLLELPIARLAASAADDEAREVIRDLSTQFHPDMELAEFRRLDREFHGAIAVACGNSLLAELSLKVLDSLFGSEEFTALLPATPPNGAVSDTVAASSIAHRRIGVAIANADPDLAELEISRHLRDVEDRMAARRRPPQPGADGARPL